CASGRGDLPTCQPPGRPRLCGRSNTGRERTRRMPNRPRTPLAEYPARRIALLKPSALGDIVHSLPVLTALRQRYPEAHITWVVNRGYEGLLRDEIGRAHV